MKTEKTINLTAYTVEYIDQREPKPRTVHAQTVVLDGGKISALNRLDMRPAGWITQQFEKDGYGFWDGRYICTQAKHTINENGFTTTVTGRRILEGY